MKYKPVAFPENIVRDSSKMTLQDAKNYFEWFLLIKDERLQYLLANIDVTKSILIKESNLNLLQSFISENVQSRNKLDAEFNIEKKVLQIDSIEFTEPIFSILFDVGVYLGELLILLVDDVVWSYEEDKDIAYYGYPVLRKKNVKKPFSPFWILEMMIKDFNNNEIPPDRLFKLFEVHKNRFNGIRKDYISLVNSWSKKK